MAMVALLLLIGKWLVASLVILIGLLLSVAYLTTAERKVIGYMQDRIGPNRHGFAGLLQPFADTIKFLSKEFIVPRLSNRYLFMTAPVMALVPALAAWAVIPFNQDWVLADVEMGLLFVLAMTSLAVYGILFAGWSSNSKYALLGSLRLTAQVISYEIAMGFSIVGVILAADSLNLMTIVNKQSGNLLHWFIWPLFPLAVIYWVSAVAETNRAPFDVVEGESELVAGFHVEYSGMGFALFFLAEYANMILVAVLMSLLFMGGWLSPFQGIAYLESWTSWVPGLGWLLMKTAFFIYLYLWMRATMPRYRYDQIMSLGWKVLVPGSLIWVMVVALMVLWGWL